MRSAIVNGTIIAWNGLEHYVVESGTVVFKDSWIEFVGEAYDGPVDKTIDATGRLVIPGLVNSHLHVTDTLFTKGHLEETQAPAGAAVAPNYHSLYTVLPAVRGATDADAQVAAAQCVFAELARTGSTTVVELGYDFEIGGSGDMAITERVADVAGSSGLRCYSGPRFRSYYYGGDGRGGTFYEDYGGRQRRGSRSASNFVRAGMAVTTIACVLCWLLDKLTPAALRCFAKRGEWPTGTNCPFRSTRASHRMNSTAFAPL